MFWLFDLMSVTVTLKKKKVSAPEANAPSAPRSYTIGLKCILYLLKSYTKTNKRVSHKGFELAHIMSGQIISLHMGPCIPGILLIVMIIYNFCFHNNPK